MGSSSSRLGSSRSRSRVNRSSSSSLSSFLLCGASSSQSSSQMEEHCEVVNEVQNPRVELSSGSVSSSNAGIEANLGNGCNGGLRNIGTSRSKEQGGGGGFGHNESAGVDRASSETVANTSAIGGVGGSERNGASSSRSDAAVLDDRVGEGSFGLDSRSSARISNLPEEFHPFGGGPSEEEASSGLGFVVSNTERAGADGSVLHVDVLSISSNILSDGGGEGSNREARRNGRRMFWDALWRRSSRRLLDSPTFVFSMDDNEDVGSRDGWVFGLSGDFLDDANGSDSGYLGSSRIQYSSDRRRRHSRSEVWERLRGGFDESGRQNTFCPSGLHPDGSCSCESLLINEESNTRASISRIVMLAEALFEVLDEIHRQPVSLSLSMVSSPAPASVVDAFPLKSHSKIDKDSKDVEECYICLAEYEEGDKIRVLPCHHEYHMSCVDKWLKEIHGVCPLCRGDVRDGLTECSVSNSEIPSV